ncbi:MAG: hypothetical protein CMJ20_11805 [Phycisphaeraceae bacterium]|nr:hypothetical protein [Phycisphaeraceae bacterium]|tara:strand:+ start:3537 stop:3734 length:198 start_codon:yes stop_codon:yes gene_type:complete
MVQPHRYQPTCSKDFHIATSTHKKTGQVAIKLLITGKLLNPSGYEGNLDFPKSLIATTARFKDHA